MALILPACLGVDAEDGSPAPAPSSQEQPIINGNLDTTRHAVIAVLGGQSACTGTIVQTDRNTGVGWVLTAAHCVDDPPQYIAQGNDYNSANAIFYEVIDYEAHPAYSDRTSAYDFAVIRFAGASTQTPVIPVVTGADGLRSGSTVTSVGYGRTTPGEDPNDTNTRRRNITKTLSFTEELFLVYSLDGGGICFGDSGGPVLANVGGSERVVGVHSSVSGLCEGEGYSGRISGVYSSWLQGQLSGQVEQTCELCRQVAFSGDGACTGTVEACQNSQACSGLLGCFDGCAANDDACTQRCADQFDAGLDLYLAIFDCACNDACPDICLGDPSCPEAPSCGVAFADQTCNSCLEGACCNELQACADNTTCLDCLSENSAACASNRQLTTFSTCAQESCAADCGIEEAACGFTAEDSCGACLEGRCCDEGIACSEDEECSACLTGATTDCADNTLVNDFIGCLAACPNDPCGFGEANNNTNNNPNNNTNNNPNNSANNNPNNSANNNINNSNNSANNNPNNSANNTGNNAANNAANNAGNNAANNSAGNNAAGNNGGGFVEDPDDDDDGGGGGGTRRTCSTAAPATPASLDKIALLGLGAIIITLIRRR